MVQKSQFLDGNKCGHNANNPRRYDTPGFARRPEIIERIKKRAHSLTEKSRGWRNYLQSLRANRKQTRTSRLQRSESRHALAWLISVIIDRTDLETLAVGRWCEQTGTFISLTLDDIHQSLKTACNETELYSFSRLKRHWRQLRDAGYIAVERRIYDTGTTKINTETGLSEKVIREDVSLKYVTRKLFRELGFNLGKKGKPTEFDKALAADRERSAASNASLRVKAGVVNKTVSDLLKESKGKPRRWYESQSIRQQTVLKDVRRRYNEEVIRLVQENPELTPAEIREKLGPPPS